MSVEGLGLPASTGQPSPVNDALEPTWVRDGPKATKDAYSLAQGFEEMLVRELSQSMAQTSGLGGEQSATGESGEAEESPLAGASPMTSELSSLLPEALSKGVMSSGGLGLAAQLTRDLQPANQASRVAASGGTDA